MVAVVVGIAGRTVFFSSVSAQRHSFVQAMTTDKLLSRRVRMEGQIQIELHNNMSASTQTVTPSISSTSFTSNAYLSPKIVLLETYFMAPYGSTNAKGGSSRRGSSSYIDPPKIYFCFSSSMKPLCVRAFCVQRK